MKTLYYKSSPWHVERPYGEEGIFIAHTESTALIARVYQGLPDDEVEANAHLIAAAPELLRLLKGLLATVKVVEAGNRNKHGDNRCGVAVELLEDCDAVIAKAENATDPRCTCHMEQDPMSPVPNHCPVHDGDYSSFLAANNCD